MILYLTKSVSFVMAVVLLFSFHGR